MTSFWQDKKVLVTGASGFVGRNFVPLLQKRPCKLFTPAHKESDLMEQADVRRLFADVHPDVVFHLAGLIGGIMANKQRPADFFYQTLVMNVMMFHEAYTAGVKKYITPIGGCSYPGNAPSPIGEDSLWKGYPQAESAPYSLGKSMNVLASRAYREQDGFNSIVLVPGNIYGPYDNFSLNNSHVIPALIRKVFEAKRDKLPQIVMWGSGKPTRDFIYISDVAEALVLAAETYDSSDIVNISSGNEITIKELVELVVRLTGYAGEVVWDATKPDGQMRKGFAVDRMRTVLKFTPRTALEEGLRKTVHWFETNYSKARL